MPLSHINPNQLSESEFSKLKAQNTHALVKQHIKARSATKELITEFVQEDVEILSAGPELASNITKLAGKMSLVLEVEVSTSFAMITLENIITLIDLTYKYKDTIDITFYQRKLVENITRFSFIATFLIGMYAFSQGEVGKNSEEETNNITPLVVILSISAFTALLAEKKLWAKFNTQQSIFHYFSSILGKGLLEAGKTRALLYGLCELAAIAINKESLLLNESLELWRYILASAAGIYYASKQFVTLKHSASHLNEEHEEKDKFDFSKDTLLAITLTLVMLANFGEASEEFDNRITLGMSLSLLLLFILKAVQISKELNKHPVSDIQIEEIHDEEEASQPLLQHNNNNNQNNEDNQPSYKQTNNSCNYFQLAKNYLSSCLGKKVPTKRMEL